MDREELIRILQQHPGIAKVTEEPLPADPNEADSIVIHFDDGTVAHMNPGLTSPLVPDETKDDLIHRIIHTVDTMKVNMTDFDPASLTNIVPLVRAADYFADHGEGSADAYGWLTDYIGRKATMNSTFCSCKARRLKTSTPCPNTSPCPRWG